MIGKGKLSWVLLAIMVAGVTIPFWVKAQESPPNLFFSEYIEGSSNNKALELYNPTNTSIELSDYYLEKYINGKVVAEKVVLPIFTLEPGKVFIICHSKSNPAIIEKCHHQTGNWDVNGNDAIVLRNSEGVIVDAFGQVGVDPGTAWGTEPNTTHNHTMVRKCLITHGDNNSDNNFDPINEWDTFDVDTFSKLGSHTNCITSTLSPTLEPTITNTPTIIIPTETPVSTPTNIPIVYPTMSIVPTESLEPSQTPIHTLTPTVDSSPTVTSSVTPVPSPPQNYGKWEWVCKTTYIKFKIFRKMIEIPIKLCRFSLLHK